MNAGILYGYARVSTKEQRFDLQLDALKNAGCQRIFKEVAKGALNERPELNKLLEIINEGDTLIIWKLDRLGRSMHHLITTLNDLNARGVAIKSLNDPIDTTTSQGRLMLNMFASMAEFEKEMIRERTMAGLASARARGRIGGRRHGLSKKAEKIAASAEILYRKGDLTSQEISDQLGIAKPTLYKYLRHRNVPIGFKDVPTEPLSPGAQ